MREFCVIASRRSGHHAVIDWIRRTAGVESEHLNNVGVDRHAAERIAEARERSDDGLVIYNYESKPIAEIEDNQSQIDGMVDGEREVTTIVVLRDFHNNFASLIYSEPPQCKPEPWFQQLLDLMGEYLDFCDGDEEVILIHFDRWNSDLNYRNRIAERLGLTTEPTIDYTVSWVGSSFGAETLNSDHLNSRWRWLRSSQRLHALSRNGGAVSLQSRLRPVSGDLREWLEGKFEPTAEVFVLTYGAPAQLWEFLNSLRTHVPELMSEAGVTVVNQTPRDSPTTEDYEAVVEEFSVAHVYGENRGTSGGRYKILKRFAQHSSADYAFIFEDDQVASGPGDGPCESGFHTHVPGLYVRCIDMIQRYELDYLMLCFSEVYDTHSSRRSGVDGRAEYEIMVRHGLACAVGEAFYSNWPIAIRRSSVSKIIDLEKPDDEGTIAEKCYPKIKSGEVKAGVLCATPFKHDRVQDYRLPREEM